MIGSICFFCEKMIDNPDYKNIPLDGYYHSNLWFHVNCYGEIDDQQKYLENNIERIHPYNYGIPTKEQKRLFKKNNEEE